MYIWSIAMKNFKNILIKYSKRSHQNTARESNLAHHPFLYGHEIFTFLNSCRKSKRKVIFCDIWNLYEIQVSVSTNENFIVTQPCILVHILSRAAFMMQMIELNSLDKDLMTYKAWNIYYWTIYKVFQSVF